MMLPLPSLLRRNLPAIAVIAMTGMIGYAIGLRAKVVPDGSALEWKNPPSPAAGEDITPPRNGERRRDLARLKRRVSVMVRTSPDFHSDFETQREIRAMLAGLGATELEEWYSSKDFLSGSADRALQKMLLIEWALKDGPAAVVRSAPTFHRAHALEAFDAWAYREPEKALSWLEEAKAGGSLPEGGFDILSSFLKDYGAVDFALASQHLGAMSERNRKITLAAWGSMKGSSPELDEGVEALLADPARKEEAMALRRGMVAKLANDDPAAALAHIAGLDLPPDGKATLDLVVMADQAASKPVQAFDEWMARNPGMTSVPEEFWTSFDWAAKVQRDQVGGWAESLAAGGFRDQIYERAAGIHATDGNFERAATFAAGIEDPARREATIEALHLRWHRTDPAAADAWVGKSGRGD